MDHMKATSFCDMTLCHTSFQSGSKVGEKIPIHFKRMDLFDCLGWLRNWLLMRSCMREAVSYYSITNAWGHNLRLDIYQEEQLWLAITTFLNFKDPSSLDETIVNLFDVELW